MFDTLTLTLQLQLYFDYSTLGPPVPPLFHKYQPCFLFLADYLINLSKYINIVAKYNNYSSKNVYQLVRTAHGSMLIRLFRSNYIELLFLQSYSHL